MNYEEMSDKDINLEVAKYFYDHEWLNRHYHLHKSSFDYCNRPEDAWQIIVDNRISIMYDQSEEGDAEWWNAVAMFHDDTQVHYQSNPLRAAMICFLKMKDAEKC